MPWACERGTPPTFSWTGEALTSRGSKTPQSPVLTLTRRPQDHGTNRTCRATFPGGAGVSTEKTIQLNVSYPPWNLTIRTFRGNSTGISCSCRQISGEQWGTWPLTLTLIGGALMGAGFLLTYGLAWIYCPRFRGSEEDKAAGCN
ncbi:sialic acid-binding Ig-like lectin 6 isoform X2 [Ailuropoda melanoleuca]|uniref:sialic acid-binding Ig-like lectin 6 isoform X2 n=1 Tax=Ailuropoda melanoleuca TaxID=9646 RepID=UPI001494D5E7|nr:sialic acid-binding Ig-like lectin 6 isoform X2 [Ailuropoda melanoleuca]